MVHIPCTYALSEESVISLITALEGDIVEQTRWAIKFKNWKRDREMQTQVYHLVKDWYTEFGKANGWTDIGGSWYHSPEEALRERVYNQMERTPYEWSEKEKKVVWNKYRSSGYSPNETEQKLLTYLNENIKI